MNVTFDLFNGHFDRQNGWTTQFAYQSVHHQWHDAKLDDDFDGHSDGDVTFKQTFTTESFYVILRVHSHLRFPSCELLRELFAK